MSLLSIVLAPFVGAYDLFGIDYRGRPVEALSECVSDQGSRRGMVTTDPNVDITQQMISLFDGDAALQDPGVASFVEFVLHKNEGLGAACEPSNLCLVRW